MLRQLRENPVSGRYRLAQNNAAVLNLYFLGALFIFAWHTIFYLWSRAWHKQRLEELAKEEKERTEKQKIAEKHWESHERKMDETEEAQQRGVVREGGGVGGNVLVGRDPAAVGGRTADQSVKAGWEAGRVCLSRTAAAS